MVQSSNPLTNHFGVKFTITRFCNFIIPHNNELRTRGFSPAFSPTYDDDKVRRHACNASKIVPCPCVKTLSIANARENIVAFETQKC